MIWGDGGGGGGFGGEVKDDVLFDDLNGGLVAGQDGEVVVDGVLVVGLVVVIGAKEEAVFHDGLERLGESVEEGVGGERVRIRFLVCGVGPLVLKIRTLKSTQGSELLLV